MAPKLSPLNSSSLEACGHDPDANELHVKFRNGGGYVFHGISADQHQAMMDAPSKGRHLAMFIKPVAEKVSKL